MAIGVLEFALVHVHVCIHRCMFARMFSYAVEMVLHLSVCMCTFKHSCGSLCTELSDCCVCSNMCVAGCLPGSWWCHRPGGLAGRIQSCSRWCSGLHCRSGGQGYCTWALHCGLRVPGSQWLRTNNVHNCERESERGRAREREKNKLKTTFKVTTDIHFVYKITLQTLKHGISHTFACTQTSIESTTSIHQWLFNISNQ